MCVCQLLFLFAVCVTIDINDNAFGQFSFDSDSVAVTIDEAEEIITAANGNQQCAPAISLNFLGFHVHM